MLNTTKYPTTLEYSNDSSEKSNIAKNFVHTNISSSHMHICE